MWMRADPAIIKVKNIESLPEMSIEDFNKDVYKRGRNLVILDNYVLNFNDYHHYHPGGRFMLEKNRGRDISKFFYGGY